MHGDCSQTSSLSLSHCWVHSWNGVCGYVPPFLCHLGVILAPVGVAYTLLGLQHLFAGSLAKSILEGLALLRARSTNLGAGTAFTRIKACLAGECRSEVQGLGRCRTCSVSKEQVSELL